MTEEQKEQAYLERDNYWLQCLIKHVPFIKIISEEEEITIEEIVEKFVEEIKNLNSGAADNVSFNRPVSLPSFEVAPKYKGFEN